MFPVLGSVLTALVFAGAVALWLAVVVPGLAHPSRASAMVRSREDRS